MIQIHDIKKKRRPTECEHLYFYIRQIINEILKNEKGNIIISEKNSHFATLFGDTQTPPLWWCKSTKSKSCRPPESEHLYFYIWQTINKNLKKNEKAKETKIIYVCLSIAVTVCPTENRR